MSTPDTKLTIELATLLKGLPTTLKGLGQVEKKLKSVANIKANTTATVQSLNKAALASQRLLQQQQRLAVASQELANRQVRARQSADRLAVSQKKITDSAQKAAQRLGQQADAHVKQFRVAESAANRLRLAQERLAKQSAASLQRQRSTALTAQQRRQEQAAAALQRQRSAALIKTFKDQERAAAQAARKREQEARKAADAEIREAKRAAKQITENQRRLVSGLRSFGQGLRSLGQSLIVGLTAPLAALSAISVKSARDLDDQVNILRAFTGSAEEAEKRLAELIATAQRTPGLTTSLGLILDSQLRVADVTVETIDKILPAIGKLNAVSRLQDPQRFTQNLVQLVTQNFERIDLKELVGQSPLAGQIVKELFNVDSPINGEAIREAAKKMGLTTTDAFFAAFAEAAGRNQALATITESISSRFGKAVDRVMVALRPLGLAIVDAITPAINALIPVIEMLGKAFTDLPRPAQQAILILGGLAALLGPFLVVVGGIVTGLGALITALTAVASVIGTIGFPALLASLGLIVVALAEWAAISFAVFKAWQTNFLGIRQLVANAANAVFKAFREIKAVFDEATRRILPTLASITNKVVTTITALWERYGKDIVEVVGGAFAFIVDVTKTFLRVFGNFVDLVAKLIDNDWRGAWRAFSRIVLTAITGLFSAMQRLNSIVTRAFRILLSFILSQAIRFVAAAEELARRFIASLVSALLLGAPQVGNAILLMFLAGIAGLTFTGIAGILVRKFIAAVRAAAAEEDTGETDTGPKVGVDIGGEAFRKGAPKAKRGRPGVPSGDDKQARSLLDKLRQLQDEFLTIQAEGRLEEVRAGIEQQFQLTKDALERELELLNANFEDRLVVVKKFFAERKKLEEAAIDAELTREKGLSSALFQEFSDRRKEIEREFQTTKEDIERDPKLKGRQRTLALQTAEQEKQNKLAKALNDLESANADVSTRILILQQKRKRITTDLTREEKNLTDELTRQQNELRFDLLEEQGALSDATAGRLTAQFKEILKDLRVDLSSLSPELQTAINNVDLSLLKSRLEELPEPVRTLIELLEIGIQKARIAERVVDVDRTLAELRIQEGKIQDKVVDGVLTEKEAREQILALQGITRGRLLDILAAQLAIAKATPGQEDEVLRIEEQIQQIERLGKVADSVGQEINRALFSDIGSGLEDLLNSARKGFEGLRDAALGFLDNLLSTLNRFAAEGILQKLEGVFKPDAENTEGTPGGFLSKLFGLKPKAADVTTLTTAAATAGTALTTGATAASAALTTGGATASATIVTSLTAAASAFSAAVIAAGAAFAAAVSASSAANAVGGLGSAFAATGLFPAVPGGVVRIVEGGYPEAVLTTDPKHAARQVQILKAYLKKTKGLFGRIPMPGLDAGGFISARDAEMNLLSSIQRSPSSLSNVSDAALATAGGISELRLRQIFVDDQRDVRNYLNSSEGEKVIAEKLVRNQFLIKRLAR